MFISNIQSNLYFNLYKINIFPSLIQTMAQNECLLLISYHKYTYRLKFVFNNDKISNKKHFGMFSLGIFETAWYCFSN